MLVLSRRPDERLMMDGPCVVTVLHISPNSVKLGIEAPKTTNIVREELLSDQSSAPGGDHAN